MKRRTGRGEEGDNVSSGQKGEIRSTRMQWIFSSGLV